MNTANIGGRLALLNDAEWAGWADREIARHTNTSAPFVASIRQSVTVNTYSEARTYTTKHGTVTTMNTANIGGRLLAELRAEDATVRALAEEVPKGDTSSGPGATVTRRD